MEDPQKNDILLQCLDGILENETTSNEEKTVAAGVRKILVNHETNPQNKHK
jgi:hypothetical protein